MDSERRELFINKSCTATLISSFYFVMNIFVCKHFGFLLSWLYHAKRDVLMITIFNVMSHYIFDIIVTIFFFCCCSRD